MTKKIEYIICIVSVLLFSISAASADEVTLTTTTTTVNRGDNTPIVKTSTVTGSPEGMATVNTNASDSSATTPGSTGSSTSETSSGANAPTVEKEKKDLTISGVYNDRQIVPNTMAILCQVSAEDMVNDTAKLFNCVNKLVLQMKSSNAATAASGVDNMTVIQYEELKTLFTLGVQKGIKVSQFEQNQKELNGSTADAKTEQEDNIIIANSINFLNEVVNSMRDLYAERLKSEALSGIQYIEASVVEDMIEKKKEETTLPEEKDDDPVLTAFSTSVTYTAEEPYTTEWLWVKDNDCERQVCTGQAETVEGLNCKDETKTCPDGTFQSKSGDTEAVCTDGECILYDKGEYANVCDDSDNLPELTGYKLIADDSGNYSCTDGNKTVACPDGRITQEMGYVACKNGKCEGCLSEAEVVTTIPVVMYMNGKCMKSDGKINECPDGGPYPTSNPTICVKCSDGNCIECSCETDRGSSSEINLDIESEVDYGEEDDWSVSDDEIDDDKIKIETPEEFEEEDSRISETADTETKKPGLLKRIFTKSGRTEYRNWKEEQEEKVFRDDYERALREYESRNK